MPCPLVYTARHTIEHSSNKSSVDSCDVFTSPLCSVPQPTSTRNRNLGRRVVPAPCSITLNIHQTPRQREGTTLHFLPGLCATFLVAQLYLFLKMAFKNGNCVVRRLR